MALLCALTGCGASHPSADVADRIAAGTGIAGVRLERSGAPTDVREPDPETLSLADAVELSVRRSPAIQAALADLAAAWAESRQARLLPNPVLSIALRFPESGGTPDIEASLAADLIALLRTPREISAADNRLRAAAGEAVVVALDVALAAQEAYAEALALEQQLAVVERQCELNRRLLDIAQARLEAGESGRLDVLTLDAQRVELAADHVQKSSEARAKRLALARLIGQPSGDAAWKLGPWMPAEKPAAGERDWIGAALRHRPELEAQRWQLAALGDDVALSGLAAFDGGEAGVDAERDDGEWAVGPAVSVPIPALDWGQARRRKAEAQRLKARHELTAARRQVIEDVRRAYVQHTSSLAALKTVGEELVPVQERRHEQAEASYRAGLTDIAALYQAEQDVEASRLRLVDAQQDVAISLARLRRAAGGQSASPSGGSQ
jgi:cobalt-zinc-cadmium efflux system outer membrane protein